MNKLQLIVCGDRSSGRSTLPSRPGQDAGADHRALAITEIGEEMPAPLSVAAVGAARADAALIVVDVTRAAPPVAHRMALLVHVMGVRHVAFVANKLDLLEDPEAR